MKELFLISFIAAMSFLPAQVAAARQVPFDGPIEAYVSIMKGIGTGVTDEDPHKDVGLALDGTVLELGDVNCMVSDGHCVFQHVKPGPHAPGIMIHADKPHLGYRYLGTSAGPIVTVERDSAGNLIVAPQGTNILVFKLERYFTDDETDIIAASDGAGYHNVSIDASLKVEIWLHITDASEGISYYRRPSAHELKGSHLRLGSYTCKIEGMQCIFEKVLAGKYHMEAYFKRSDAYTLTLEKDEKPFEVARDWWTRRPKVKQRKEPVTITIEQNLLKHSEK